jgi:hypothetical protein
MKTCPHCGGDIRPSVIKCVHCGTSLVDEPSGQAQPVGVAPGAPYAGAVRAGPYAAAASSAPVEAAAPAAPASTTADAPEKPRGMPGRPTAPPPSVFDPPAQRRSGDPWVTPSVRADALVPLPQSALLASTAAPVTATRRVNKGLMVAGVLAVASSVAAITSMSLPWVTGTVWATGNHPNPRFVAELTFAASDGFVGRVVPAVAVVTGLLGLLWFWYGLDRGVHLPWFAHPGVALGAGSVAWAALATARLGTFAWGPAFVSHAREADVGRRVMRTLLQDAAAHRVELAQQQGMVRFAVAASLALLAGIVAWWSQRARTFG